MKHLHGTAEPWFNIHENRHMKHTLPAGSISGIAMRYIVIGALSLLISLFSPFRVSANISEDNEISDTAMIYQIGRWHGFRKAAFTISFDDNYRFQVTYATPVLNQYNYKATYFIVTNRVGKGWAPGWDTVNILALQGHEIASHSKNHADFINLYQHPQWADSMIHELRDSRDTINARVPSQQCETFAWPNGSVNGPVIEVGKNYYMACRGTFNLYEDSVPQNYYNICSRHIYHDTPLNAVNAFIDSVIMLKGWLVERWHGFRVGNDTNGYEPVPIEIFEDHLAHVSLNADSLWITTLDSVVRYIQERQSSILVLTDSTENLVHFRLTNNLPDTTFHYTLPLSLKVRIYGEMAKVHMITQGSNLLPYKILTERGYKYLYFDAVPNDSLIELHLSDVGTHDLLTSENNAVNNPNPFAMSTTVLFSIPEAEKVDIRVYDQSGRRMRDCSNFYTAGRNSFEFKGDGLSPGVYHCIIKTRERTTEVRMIMRR